MDNGKIKVLVVDDETDIRKIVRLLLQNKGYSVSEAANGALALEAVRQDDIDLIIMDIMMPQMSGVEATAAIREISTAPVLFLTAKSLDRDKESAYGSGGDDYLVKPFSSSDLILKVESLLRRYMVYKGKETSLLHLPCGVEVDVGKRTVRKNGNNPGLRDKENEMFFYLLDHRGEIISSDALYEAVWGEKALPSSANNVMVNMLGIRKKLEDDPSSPELIKTVWGKGYRFE
ncbi:MAG: response regulator transcription factor [Clostridia bacterium]|nr:response regulator transcription factor [Clostridia bacterium]